ncbi:hypothetical protein HDU97_004686 [Phlyctochytrium planicorne]|nr:hypothetical protein HDU97_004686 [Phlyctochytrium planicorne]
MSFLPNIVTSFETLLAITGSLFTLLLFAITAKLLHYHNARTRASIASITTKDLQSVPTSLPSTKASANTQEKPSRKRYARRSASRRPSDASSVASEMDSDLKGYRFPSVSRIASAGLGSWSRHNSGSELLPSGMTRSEFQKIERGRRYQTRMARTQNISAF